MQAFSSVITLVITGGGFYLIYKIVTILVNVIKIHKSFKEISSIVDRGYTGEPYDSEIKDVIDRVRKLAEMENND